MPLSGALAAAMIKKETTPGTYAAPTTTDHGFLFVDSLPTGSLETPRYFDQSLRASLQAMNWDATATTQKWTLDLEGPFTLGSGGHLLMATLGLDSVTGTTVGVHTFSSTSTTYPPTPTYSITTYDGANGANWWGYVGCVLNNLELKVNTEGVATYKAQFVAVSRSSQSAPTCVAESGTNFGQLVGYQTSVSVGGTTDVTFEEVTYTWERNASHNFTLNGSATASVANRQAGPLQGSFKGTSYYNDQTMFDYFRLGTKASFSTVIGTTNAQVAITCTSPDWTSATVAAGGPDDIHRLDVEGTMLYSTTDSGICRVTLRNGRTTAY